MYEVLLYLTSEFFTLSFAYLFESLNLTKPNLNLNKHWTKLVDFF